MKKSISLLPLTYYCDYAINHFAMVSIYGFDGIVAVLHGGIEVGQGIDTKVMLLLTVNIKEKPGKVKCWKMC